MGSSDATAGGDAPAGSHVSTGDGMVADSEAGVGDDRRVSAGTAIDTSGVYEGFSIFTVAL